MSLSDPIADMLTRIRNAVRNKADHVMIRQSKVCAGIAKVLTEEGYIAGFDPIDDGTGQGLLRVNLKYGSRGEQVIHKVQRVSRPSARVYRGVDDLPRVLDGLGIAIVSTSSGILSDRQAREKRVGGELLATVE
ncbi:MAG: 30S ribosomal protein S8 [Planctomycetes bacterium]|nr:30S ribosomal protein S8 [Planctomycetota bacterium]